MKPIRCVSFSPPVRVLQAALLALTALPAQGVVRTVPGNFATIPAALAASAPGDVVEIGAGTYPAFDCAVGVTLRAAVPGTVTFDLAIGILPSTGVPMTFAAPAGQTIHVVGIGFRFPDAGSFTDALPQVTLSGRSVFEECWFTSDTGNAKGGLRIAAGAQAHLQEVTTRGPLVWAQGKLTATQCDLRGPAVTGFTTAAIAVDGTLQASSCTIVGGSSGFQAAGPAVSVGAAGSAWISDSTLEAGSGSGAACAVGGSADLVRCVVNTPACVTQSPEGLGVRRLQPFVIGGAIAVDYRNSPGVPIVVHASTELGDVVVPFLAQPWGAPLGGSFDVALALADPAGNASFSWAIPASPALVDLPLWLHGFSGLAFPLQVSPPVGGVIR